MFVKLERIHDGKERTTTIVHREEECVCKKMYVSFIIEDPKGDRGEYVLLACDRIPMDYIYDMYFLYTGDYRNYDNDHPKKVDRLERNTILHLPSIIDVDLWLTGGGSTPTTTTTSFPCIKCYTRSFDDRNQSLTVYLARPRNSKSYYALGKDGTLLLSADDENDMAYLRAETVNMLLRNTTEHCHRPSVWRADWSQQQC
ncbi:hypothetical protein RF55_23366 [Lasius niger]|uniref:Uncharacterized protein n=1 Tax=Lasius niger TaxID=67767 RepID=A0A0J7JWM9_LASNI|nr:hypothetical protein RF55_23366 [Lasius niger]